MIDSLYIEQQKCFECSKTENGKKHNIWEQVKAERKKYVKGKISDEIIEE